MKFDQENLTKGPNEMMSWRLKFVRVVEIGISKELQPYDVNRKHAEEDYLQGKLRETESERITRPFLLNNALRQIISFNFQTYIKMFFLKLKDSSSTSKVEFHAKSTDMAFLKAAYLSLSLIDPTTARPLPSGAEPHSGLGGPWPLQNFFFSH